MEYRSSRGTPDDRSGRYNRGTPSGSVASGGRRSDLERSPPDSSDDTETRGTMHHNLELRRRLEEEHASYKRKLMTYQEGQQRQAQLVQKLQNKILQYKKKNSELEQKLIEARQNQTSTKVLQSRHEEEAAELEATILLLEEERQRNNSVTHMNTVLREQLDEASTANQGLNRELHRVTEELTKYRSDLDRRENEWRREEKSFNDYFSAEHSRLLLLWRSVLAFRRQFADLKANTEKDLGQIKTETERAGRTIHGACQNLIHNLNTVNNQTKGNLDREKQERTELTKKLDEKTKEARETQDKLQRNIGELTRMLEDMRRAKEKLQDRLNERDRTLFKLNSMRGVEGSSMGSDAGDVGFSDHDSRALIDETERMHRTLRDISDLVVKETENEQIDLAPLHVDTLANVASPRSPMVPGSAAGGYHGSSSHYSPAFASLAFTSIQSLLSKRNVQVRELRTKLTTTNEQLNGLQHQLEENENLRRSLERSNRAAQEELDSTKREHEDTLRERDRVRTELDLTGSEKSQLEKLKAGLADQMAKLRQDVDRLNATNQDVTRLRDSLEDERDDLRRDLDRMKREAERSEKSLQVAEEKRSKVKEELTDSKASLSKLSLEREGLQQQLNEVDGALKRAEDTNIKLEQELGRRRADEAALKESLARMQSAAEAFTHDKANLKRLIQQYEAEKTALYADKNCLEQEKSGLKEELIQVEKEKVDLETEKSDLVQSFDNLSTSRNALEKELSTANHDKHELSDQLNRIKYEMKAVQSDLEKSQREVERQADKLLRLTKEREELISERSTLVAQVASWEEQNDATGDQLADVMAEKEQHETSLFEAKQLITQLESSKDALHRKNKDLETRKEELQAEIARLRREFEVECGKLAQQRESIQSRLSMTERDLHAALEHERALHAADLQRDMEEKAVLENSWADKYAEYVSMTNREKEETTLYYEREKEELSAELAALQRTMESGLLAGERSKQEVLASSVFDKNALSEKVVKLEADLRVASQVLEKFQREYGLKAGADKATIESLNQEIKALQKEQNQLRVAHEKASKASLLELEQMTEKRDEAVKEFTDTRARLKLVEEARETLRRELLETTGNLREMEETRDHLRQEIQELKRTLIEEQRTREDVERSCEELRVHVHELDGMRIEQTRSLNEKKQKLSVLDEHTTAYEREVEDLRVNLRELEKARSEAKKEVQEMRRRAKTAEAERDRLTGELEEMQARVAREEEKEEQGRRNAFSLKQKLVESDASRESVVKEIQANQRKITELEEELRVRVKEIAIEREQARLDKSKWSESKAEIKTSLDAANQEAALLQVSLNQTENRRVALENSLRNSESQRRDIENRLGAIVSALRRLIGFKPASSSAAGGHNTPNRFLHSRSNSPSKGLDHDVSAGRHSRPVSPGRHLNKPGGPRAHSPFHRSSGSTTSSVYGGEGGRHSRAEFSGHDVDPEAVRQALRDFVQQMVTAERERDDALATKASLDGRLREQIEKTQLAERRGLKLQEALVHFEEDKKCLEEQLSSTTTALLMKEDECRQMDKDLRSALEKINNLERQLGATENDKNQLQDRVMAMKEESNRHYDDKRHQKRTLEDHETRYTQLEMAKVAVEGELKRVKALAKEKEADCQTLQGKLEAAHKEVQDLETNVASLQVTIDRLTATNQKTETEVTGSKEQVNQLNVTISEQMATIRGQQDKVAELQKTIASTEHDNRVLQDRLDSARTALAEQKQQNHLLSERLESLRRDLAEEDLRRSELEGVHRQTSGLLAQREEARQEMGTTVKRLTGENQALAEKVSSLQRALTEAEASRVEMSRELSRLEKDKSLLKKTTSKLERERNRNQDNTNKTVQEKSDLENQVRHLEEEKVSLQRQLEEAENQMTENEQQQSKKFLEAAGRQRGEDDAEIERLRSSLTQAEIRERTQRHRLKAMEEEISSLQTQLTQELRQRKRFLGKPGGALMGGYSGSTNDLSDLRLMLDTSLPNAHYGNQGAHFPDLDIAQLEADTRPTTLRSSIRHLNSVGRPGSIGSPAIRRSPFHH